MAAVLSGSKACISQAQRTGRHGSVLRIKCSAAQTPRVPTSAPDNTALVRAVEALFKFKPFFSWAANNARAKIVKRAEEIGVEFNKQVAELSTVDWEAEYKRVCNPEVELPEYYTRPFHAYPEGNLCWEAALEVTAAAKSVHATVMDPAGQKLDPRGDEMLRSSYSMCMKEMLAGLGVDASSIRSVLDVGCATGLSSLELQAAFPDAQITGNDLSVHFLAVGNYLQRQRQATPSSSHKKQQRSISFLHAAAEDTGLPECSYDLISACLVLHELPQDATKTILREAHRLLKPGGAIAIMEMNPASPVWQRIFQNPFAYAAFKSTEPWLTDYVALDLRAALHGAGFDSVQQMENTPRHRTVVASKPGS